MESIINKKIINNFNCIETKLSWLNNKETLSTSSNKIINKAQLSENHTLFSSYELSKAGHITISADD
ncbi:MAG: hypothetical protein N4A62_08530 [Marinisporobacter sp.]|jgi:hypothetical protein|nr:hypothetical protein [Marinisporobacter sp.]